MRGKKTGGRGKGTPNKVTAMSKEVIADLLREYSESGKMGEDFNQLKPMDRITIAEKLMQYVMPKCQSVAVDLNDATKERTIEDRLAELTDGI